MAISSPVLIFSYDNYEKLSKFKMWDNCYFIPSDDAIEAYIDKHEYIIDHSGSGVYKNKFILRSGDLLKAIENDIKNISPDSIGRDIKGSLSGYIINKRAQKVTIIPDPLGGAMVFYYKTDSLTLFSNSINNIVSVLKDLGFSLKKSVDYISEIIGTGNGGFFESSYENIHVLKPFQYVIGISNNFSIEEYSWKQELFSADKDYDEQIRLAVAEIKNNISAVTNYQGASYKIAHLTGGFDSRLVLSGILGTNSADHYHFFCSGRPEMPDRNIAEKLSSELGLTMTEYSGFSSLKSPETLEDKYLLPMKFSEGILPASPHSFYERNPNIILSGGYGECFRSFFGARVTSEEKLNLESLIIELWGRLFFNENHEDALFSASFKKRLSDKMKLFFSECRDLGLREDAYLDYMYLRIRNRYYVGVTSHNWSNFGGRFDPLYSLNGIMCALSVPQDIRSANIVGIDIMNQLHHELSEYPFDRNLFNETYTKLRGNTKIREFSNNNRPNFALSELVNHPVSSIKSSEALPTHIEKAKRLKAPLWQVVELNSVQKKCLEYLATMNSRQVESIFNRKILFRLLKNELNNRVHIRTVFSIYSMLLWYFNEDKVSRN